MTGITFNEDCNHFFFTRGPERMTVEGSHQSVDHYVSPQVREMIFNVNGMRIGYASRVFQPMWDGLDPEAGPEQPFLVQGRLLTDQKPRVFQSILNARLLHGRGSIRMRSGWPALVHGKEAWISVRMNDVHFVDLPEGWTVCDFWKRHPEYWRVRDRFENWTDRAYDYGHKEVRDYHLALVDEILTATTWTAWDLAIWNAVRVLFPPGV